ncbi:MAG: hypothetical protein PHF63_00030 [Herbinix sp.]|nr:hypothetical protein [Herbinix sp.]
MKKIISIMLVVFMVIIVSGCNTITRVPDKQIEEFQKCDFSDEYWSELYKYWPSMDDQQKSSVLRALDDAIYKNFVSYGQINAELEGLEALDFALIHGPLNLALKETWALEFYLFVDYYDISDEGLQCYKLLYLTRDYVYIYNFQIRILKDLDMTVWQSYETRLYVTNLVKLYGESEDGYNMYIDQDDYSHIESLVKVPKDVSVKFGKNYLYLYNTLDPLVVKSNDGFTYTYQVSRCLSKDEFSQILKHHYAVDSFIELSFIYNMLLVYPETEYTFDLEKAMEDIDQLVLGDNLNYVIESSYSPIAVGLFFKILEIDY